MEQFEIKPFLRECFSRLPGWYERGDRCCNVLSCSGVLLVTETLIFNLTLWVVGGGTS